MSASPSSPEALAREIEAAGEALWAEGAPPSRLAAWQALHRDYEAALARQKHPPERHRFVVVIPVADRPRQLRLCLQSLLDQCRAFHYGGVRQGRFERVEVVIADDSGETVSRRAHARLAEEFTAQGLPILHFDQPEQRELLRQAGAAPVSATGRADEAGFGHKGASRMRNLCYLLLRRLAAGSRECWLFFFIDSDQEFRVRLADGRNLLGISYFHALDRLFRERDIRMLTGKVVGDPPVSPAVMAGHLLDDLIAFLERLRAGAPDAPCAFHGEARGADDAAYHDMADLFGFRGPDEVFEYRCDVEGKHDLRAAFQRFAVRAPRFLDGEHPTRASYYRPGSLDASIAPARTVYTGNYVLNVDALEFFIPFATLRLRMAGPVLGRIARAELGAAFVSANLPLLHKRTHDAVGRSEFRPGVEHGRAGVDLSGEFERQFFGDVMLFSIEALCEQGYPGRLPPRDALQALVEDTSERLRARYAARQRDIAQRLERASELAGAPDAWWNQDPDSAAAAARLQGFLADLRRNFSAGSGGCRQVEDDAHRAARLREIREAILALPDDREAWRAALARIAGQA